MKALYAVLISLVIVTTAHAEESFFDKHEVTIGYAPVCHHILEDGSELNERNNHAILVSVDQWFGMTFLNSHSDRTFAAGYTFRTPKWKPFKEETWFLRGNLSLGLMYGYKDKLPNVGGVTIAAAPTFEIGYKKFSIDTMVLPVTVVMFKWTF